MSTVLLLILLHLKFKCLIYGKPYGTFSYLFLYHGKPLRVLNMPGCPTILLHKHRKKVLASHTHTFPDLVPPIYKPSSHLHVPNNFPYVNCLTDLLIGKSMYRNMPNKGAGCSNKVKSDGLYKKLRFSAFQRWFRIENRTIIKETMSILAIYDSIGFLQTRGRPY